MTREEGQALVEFAIVLPILLLAMLLVVTVGEIARDRIVLEHAASEGARNGSLNNDDLQIRQAVAATVRPLDPARVTVTIEPDRAVRTRRSLLTVRLAYREPLALAFVGMPDLVVRSSATRMIERDAP